MVGCEREFRLWMAKPCLAWLLSSLARQSLRTPASDNRRANREPSWNGNVWQSLMTPGERLAQLRPSDAKEALLLAGGLALACDILCHQSLDCLFKPASREVSRLVDRATR